MVDMSLKCKEETTLFHLIDVLLINSQTLLSYLFYLLIVNSHYCFDWISAIHLSEWKILKNFFLTYIKWNSVDRISKSLSLWSYWLLPGKKKTLTGMSRQKSNNIFSHLFQFGIKTLWVTRKDFFVFGCPVYTSRYHRNSILNY